jgi:thiamine pyrophosphate-dependent acetolactate synthase large subunit-like protein
MSKAQLNKVIPTGAVALIQLLEKHGVTHIFGIPGAKIDSLFIYCTSQFNYKAGNLQA